MSRNWEYKKYKVVEEYFGEKIVVSVEEKWSEDGIELADVSCPYNTALRELGHSIGNYVQSESGIVKGEIVKRLSVDDVHDAIFKEIYIAEKVIAESKKEKHDNFKSTRFLTVFVQYENQEIPIKLMLKSGDTKVWIICVDTRMECPSIEKFRDKIVEEVQMGKRMIDNGYVFPKSSTFSKMRKKIKKYFNY